MSKRSFITTGRKVLASAVSAAMVVAFTPVVAWADIGENDTGCQVEVITSGVTSHYETFASAIEAAVTGSTIQLKAAVVGNITVPAGKSITLDLNGQTITHSGTAVLNNGTLTVTDSVGGGKIVSTGNAGIGVGDNSTTTIKGGIVEGVEGAVITGYATGATIYIENGSFSASDNAVIAGNGNKTNSGGAVRENANTINISGGTFTGSIKTANYIACGIYAPWKDTFNITGGTFSITGGAGIVARAGNVNVSDSVEFNVTGTATGWVGDNKNSLPSAAIVFDSKAGYPALDDGAKISITGGKFVSEADNVSVLLKDGDANKRVEVSGGTFSADPAAYLASGYIAVQSGSAWVVRAAKHNVSFDSKGGSAIDTQVVDDASNVTKPADPTRSGYYFGGWFTDAACTQAFDFSTAVIEDFTLYAKWIEIVYDDTPSTPSTPVAPSTPEVGDNTQGVVIGGGSSAEGGSSEGSTTVDITVTDTTPATDSQGNKVDGTVSIDSISTTESAVTIPETITTDSGTFLVTSIPAGAMEDNTTVTSVEIPSSVTSIGENAFAGCTNLTSVTVPAGVTTIEQGTFAGCSNLETVEVQGDVTTIAPSAFEGCSSLTSVDIPATVTSIGESAFAGTAITSATIPAGVTTIEANTFANCENLTTVEVAGDVTVIADSAFAGCTSLTSVEIPSTVTEIGDGAFAGCENLTDVEIPAGATVGDSAFAGSGLTSVSIGKNATVGKSAFQACDDLTTATVRSKTLGAYAFKKCTGLKSVTIGSSVTKIERSAFSGCKSLKSVTIPKSVTSIGKNALYGAKNVKTLTINSKSLTKSSVKDALNGSKVTTVKVPKSMLSAYKKVFSQSNCGKKVTLKAIK